MKKKFMEPELVRIDLKITENIAASGDGTGDYERDYVAGFDHMLRVRQQMEGCIKLYVGTEVETRVPFQPDTFEIIAALSNGCFRL